MKASGTGRGRSGGTRYPVILLVTPQTKPEIRAQLIERIAEQFGMSANKITVHVLSQITEAPSKRAAGKNCWLFADGAVFTLDPQSTVLAMDAVNWFQHRPPAKAGRWAPLYQCKTKPGKGRTPRR